MFNKLIRRKILGCFLLIFLLLTFSVQAQELFEITSDDIILNEPDFSDYIKNKMPQLNKELLNLNREMPISRLKVDFKNFGQFWLSISDYYLRKGISHNKIKQLEKDALRIREKIFKQANLRSPRAMRFVIEYKFQKKNIEHAELMIETLESDLGILFQVLKGSDVTSPFNQATDLKSYAGLMVNEIQKLKANGAEYFDDFEDAIDAGGEQFEDPKSKHLKKLFLDLGIEISGAFHMKTEFSKAMSSFWDGIVRLYNYELYVMENKQITPATLLGTLFSILILIGLYYLIKRILNQIFGDGGYAFALNTLSKYGFILVILVVSLQGIGLDLAKITILVSALSVGIGFGLTTLVSNFIAGIIILIEGSISKGDKLEVGDLGIVDVMVIGIRKSILRTLDGVDVVVPNTELVSKEVVNLTHKDNSVTRNRMPFSINPHVDFKKMEEVAIATCIETLGGEDKVIGKRPFILVKELSHADLVCELVYNLDYEKNFIPDRIFKTALLNAFYENGLDIFTAPVTPVEMVKDEAAANPNVKQVPSDSPEADEEKAPEKTESPEAEKE